ncbi:MAG: SRPBCC domain-containing protein, partial [Vulcanimicrobiaceae bacterium]
TGIVEPERLAFYGKLGDGNGIATNVTFIEQGGNKTKLAVHQTYSFESDATRGAEQGCTATLDQLGEHLARG